MREYRTWVEKCNSHGCDNTWEYGIDDGRVYVALIHEDGSRTHQTWLPPQLMGYLADLVHDNIFKIMKYEEARAIAIETQDINKFIEETSKEEVMINLNGKRFRCECGCNVLTRQRKMTDTNEIVYRCNGCGEEYVGEIKEMSAIPKTSEIMKGIECKYMIGFDKGGEWHSHCEHNKLPCPYVGKIHQCEKSEEK